MSNPLLPIVIALVSGLVYSLFRYSKKGDENVELRATIRDLERRNTNLKIELSEEKFRNAVTNAINGKSKIKIEKFTTERLGASGWYFDSMPTELIKKELAYKIADQIVENNLLQYIPGVIPNRYDSRLYHTARVEIVKRG